MPALQPPEVHIDPALQRKYEQELEEAKVCELPADDDDDL